MFRIVDNRLLDLTVTVPSAEMAALRVGQPLSFSTDAVPGQDFHGQGHVHQPVGERGGPVGQGRGRGRNDRRTLKGGLFVKGRIVTGERAGVLQIPRAALLTWDVARKKGRSSSSSSDVAPSAGRCRPGASRGIWWRSSRGSRPARQVVDPRRLQRARTAIG